MEGTIVLNAKQKKINQIKILILVYWFSSQPSIHLLKVNDRNIRTKCGICSKFNIRQWHRSGAFIVTFELFHTFF